MLNIQIDGDYRITSDSHCLILKKKRIVTGKAVAGKEINPENIGKEEWDEKGYYRTIQQLIEDYSRMKVLNSNCQSFKELMELLVDIQKTISNISDFRDIKI